MAVQRKRRAMPAIDLSIDFDFFIREEWEWDFGHSENNGMVGLLWAHRYGSINIWVETNPRTYADFVPYRLLQKLEEKNVLVPKGARLIIADSHKHAFEAFRRSSANTLVNIDAHHDCFSSARKPLDCGNWVSHLRAARKELTVQQVYPKWKDVESERATLVAHAPDIYRTAAPNWDAWPALVDAHEARIIFVCFSSAWVPPHHWPAFEALISAFSTYAETDAIEVGGGFPLLKPEHYPHSVAENATLVETTRQQWAAIHQGKTPAGFVDARSGA